MWTPDAKYFTFFFYWSFENLGKRVKGRENFSNSVENLYTSGVKILSAFLMFHVIHTHTHICVVIC